MTQATLSRDVGAVRPPRSERSMTSLLRALDIDTRLLGMVVALAIIWIGFQIMSGGLFLIWRGLIFAYAQGQTIGPMDGNFALLGGGPSGSLGEVGSWVVGAVACAGIVFTVINNRRQRQTYGFPVRPIWALATVIAV